MFSMPHTVWMNSSVYTSHTTQIFHNFVLDIASLSMYALELMSVAIIVFTTINAFVKLFRKEPLARIYLLHGQSLGLTFKLGAEILRTVTAKSLMDIIEVFLLIVIKACMVLLIERELRSCQAEDAAQGEEGSVPAAARLGAPSRFRFSLFHTETQVASNALEIQQIQEDILNLQSQLDARKKVEPSKTES